VKDAISTLVKSGVINTADYWKQHYKDVQYLDALICNMAAKL
jgi:hypothetical protein